MTPSQNTVLFWYPRSVNDDWTSLLLEETWVLSLPPPLPYVPPTHIPSLSSILIDSAPDIRLKSVCSSPSLLPRPSHLSLTAVSPSQPPHDCCGDPSTTWIWSVTIPLPNPSVVSHLALDRTQTPYTHKILHGLFCLSSLISLSPLHSPAHGPVAPSGASRPLSRLSPATVVLFQAPCARFLLCGWHLLHLDVFQMTK